MTGVGGRPVSAIETSMASISEASSFFSIPLLYQINDPSAPLPMCFPHFPRLDWTLWFVPLGYPATGWLTRLFDGVTRGDKAIIGLLDKDKYYELFPTEPPQIVRIMPRTYEFSKDTARNWNVREEDVKPIARTYERDDIPVPFKKEIQPWPRTPFLRVAAETNRPEYFVWACIGTTATAEIFSKRLRVWLSEAGNEVQ